MIIHLLAMVIAQVAVGGWGIPALLCWLPSVATSTSAHHPFGSF